MPALICNFCLNAFLKLNYDFNKCPRRKIMKEYLIIYFNRKFKNE